MTSWSIHRSGRFAANCSTEPTAAGSCFYLAGNAQRLDMDAAGGSAQLGCYGRPHGVTGTSGVGIDADRRASGQPVPAGASRGQPPVLDRLAGLGDVGAGERPRQDGAIGYPPAGNGGGRGQRGLGP